MSVSGSSANSNDDEPIDLAGGTVNRPVRVGDTVRRTLGPWSAAVHHLLEHLEAVDFPFAPRFLGFDDQGREVLSYLPGTAVMRPWPPNFRSLEGPRAVARVIRLYHEAVADYVPAEGTRWFNGRTELVPGEIVIHGDLGPWNVLIDDDGTVTGIIDWDFAQPGHAISDVAYLAYYLTMLRGDDVAGSSGFTTPPDRRARLAALASEYGIDPLSLATEGYRLELERYWRIRVLGPQRQEPWAGFLDRGVDAEIESDLRWLAEHLGDVI